MMVRRVRRASRIASTTTSRSPHGDDAPVGLQLPNHIELAGGRHARAHVVDAELGRDRRGGSSIVAREQHGREPERTQPRERESRGRLERVAENDDSGHGSVDRDDDRRRTLRLSIRHD